MTYYDMDDYKFIKIEKSKKKYKKYDAIIQNKKTKKQITIPFGDTRYEQYNDSTGLKYFNHLDHGDKFRRKQYTKRHSVYIKNNTYSPGFFSMRYLWSVSL